MAKIHYNAKANAVQIMKITELRKALDEMCNDAQGKVFERVHAPTELHNNQTNIAKPTFEAKNFISVRWLMTAAMNFDSTSLDHRKLRSF